MSVFFGGRQIIKPGAYSQVDVEGMVPISVGGLKVLAVIGEADRGEPKTIKWFNNPSNAKTYYKSGGLLTGMQICWNPSPTIPGADLIAAIRVNPATQAEHTLLDGDGKNAIELTARDWGIAQYEIAVSESLGEASITVTKEGTLIEATSILDTNTKLVDYINENFTTVTAVEITADNPTIVTTLVKTNFGVSGTNPAPELADYQDCIDLLRTESIQGIVPVTPLDSVHAYALDHAVEMSGLKMKKERRIFVGHDIGDNIAAIKSRSEDLNNSRAVLATPGIKRFDADGNVTTLSAVFTACAIAGMWVGADFNYPLTYDYINALGLEVVYELLDIEDLIQAGVIVVENVPGRGYRIVQAVTTHQIDNNIAYVELSVNSLADIMSIELRDILEQLYVGKPYLSDTAESIRNTTISMLNQFVKMGWLIESEAGDPPYRNINVFKEGTAVFVEWEGSPSVPNNYVLITSSFTL